MGSVGGTNDDASFCGMIGVLSGRTLELFRKPAAVSASKTVPGAAEAGPGAEGAGELFKSDRNKFSTCSGSRFCAEISGPSEVFCVIGAPSGPIVASS